MPVNSERQLEGAKDSRGGVPPKAEVEEQVNRYSQNGASP